MLTDEQLAMIHKHREMYLFSHDHPGSFACCSAHPSADDVPLLIAEIIRLRIELVKAQSKTPAGLDEAITAANQAQGITRHTQAQIKAVLDLEQQDPKKYGYGAFGYNQALKDVRDAIQNAKED